MVGGDGLNYDMDLSEQLLNMEKIYDTTTTLHGKKIDITKIDFVGLNVPEKYDTPFEFKLYFQPIDSCEKSDMDHQIIKSIFDKRMVRCKCCAQSSLKSRCYITLKNRTLTNMEHLYRDLRNFNSCMKEHMLHYPLLYSLEESVVKKTSPILHMIGIKSDSQSKSIVNLEWLLRDIIDDKSNQYSYNDEYYLNYISSTKILEFKKLVNYIRENYDFWLRENMLHLWIMAIDLFANGRCKHKIYLKLNKDLDFFDVHLSLKRFCQCENNRLDVVENFFRNHGELKLYGFALCLDSFGEKSINYYFVSNDD